MEKGAWWATVHGGHKESVMTERLTLSLCFHTLKLASVVFCYLQRIALNF